MSLHFINPPVNHKRWHNRWVLFSMEISLSNWAISNTKEIKAMIKTGQLFLSSDVNSVWLSPNRIIFSSEDEFQKFILDNLEGKC